MSPSPHSRPPHAKLEEIFETHIQALATTLSRGTVANYRGTARRFLSYLHANFPRVRRLSQLHRDPHLLGWFLNLPPRLRQTVKTQFALR